MHSLFRHSYSAQHYMEDASGTAPSKLSAQPDRFEKKKTT